jgi:hypothetical protein
MRPTFSKPFAITMWDFSWLERRWPGAGYEDWDSALSELVERGYDAVRIDAYPHLVSADPYREWELLPVWNQQSWGAQSIVHVTVLPALIDFLRAAQRHGVSVALSSWYREDRENIRIAIRTPEDQGRIWVDTLQHIESAGLLDTIIYVDLCNEFPMSLWAPYLYTEKLARNVARRGLAADATVASLMPPQESRTSPRIVDWMRTSIDVVRSAYPDIDYTYSFCDELPTWTEQDVSMLDVMEPHIWMSNNEYSDYYDRVGYNYEAFDPTGFDNVVRHGRREYEENRFEHDLTLFRSIDNVADWSRSTHKGLYTTECWALTDYKDWPGLEWDWILELNGRAVEYAAGTGRWVGIATSNFCGPQFVGMWREVEWHQRLTSLIKSAPIAIDIRTHRSAS